MLLLFLPKSQKKKLEAMYQRCDKLQRKKSRKIDIPNYHDSSGLMGVSIVLVM